MSGRPTFMRTVHRFGYAFSAPVARARRAAARASAWWIDWERGSKRANLSFGDNTVGRDPAADICLDAVGVSRLHAAGKSHADSQSATRVALPPRATRE